MPEEGECGNFLKSLAHERICLRKCMRPIAHSHSQLQRLGLRALMWTGSVRKQSTGFSEGTAVESEQGWF